MSENILEKLKFKHQEDLDNVINKINNRESFSYDMNGDALYNKYKNHYTDVASKASEDAVGKASAMTGGYGNSYALTAGQQAYSDQMDKLDDIGMSLYNAALDRYDRETNALNSRYNMLSAEKAQSNNELAYAAKVLSGTDVLDYLQYLVDQGEIDDATARAMGGIWDDKYGTGKNKDSDDGDGGVSALKNGNWTNAILNLGEWTATKDNVNWGGGLNKNAVVKYGDKEWEIDDLNAALASELLANGFNGEKLTQQAAQEKAKDLIIALQKKLQIN
jgi:hypothetical protein